VLFTGSVHFIVVFQVLDMNISAVAVEAAEEEEEEEVG